MRVKSYYASSVNAAMGQASAELGPDAVLMHSRRTPAGLRHLGPFEVVFAIPQTGAAASPRAASSPGAVVDCSQTGGAQDPQVSLELMQMRRQIEEIRRSLATSGVRQHPVANSLAERLSGYLAGAAVDEELAREIADRAALCMMDRDAALDESAALSYFVRPEMERRLTPEPSVETGTENPPVIALIGPPGCGKTAMLVKLAVRFQEAGSDVHLVSADPFRIGAADQLRAYGAILGVDVDVAEHAAALRRLIEMHRGKGPVLIDTPGFSSADFDLMSDLARSLAAAGEICKLLLLPATMRARDLRRFLRDYDLFRPDRLAFTRLDETDLFGSIFSAAAWSGLPVSYISAGPQIPDDLETASAAKILELVLGPETAECNLVN